MKIKKRFLSILLSLALVFSLMPGMSLTAYATDYSSYLVEASKYTSDFDDAGFWDWKANSSNGGLNGKTITQEQALVWAQYQRKQTGYATVILYDGVGSDPSQEYQDTLYYVTDSGTSGTVFLLDKIAQSTIKDYKIYALRTSTPDGLVPTVDSSQEQTETLLTTITATAKEQASYSTEDIATVSFTGQQSYDASWGWWGYGWTATVTAAEGYTITKCVFYDNDGATGTDSSGPFVVETTEMDKTPQVNGVIFGRNNGFYSKGITKIEVYGYATPTTTHGVTITPGDNMTKTTDSGAASQTDLSGAMTDVVYTADDGYYFPTDYSVDEVNGISVTRDSYTQITVSGTPTADAEITLIAPTAKTKPATPATATVDCATADNNDGKLTGVSTAMEYKKSDAEEWTAGTGNDITGLVPGTYYVRVKATDTTLASDNQELTVKGFISYTVTFKVVNGSWNEGAGDAAIADKTVILTGHDGDTLKLTADQIPAVGTKPNDTYKAGSWNVVPSTETEITAATTYTYTYAEKEAAVVTKAPEAKTLTYNGQAQALVIAGSAEGGEMQYVLGTDATTAPTSGYTTSIPTATDAGT